jgi:hypothetical protein
LENHGKILYEESDKHLRNQKWFYLGQVILLFIIGCLFLELAIFNSGDIMYFIFALILFIIVSFLLWMYYIETRTLEKFRIFETGINFGDSRTEFFTPFNTINKVERVYSPKFKRPGLKIYLRDGTIRKIGSHRSHKDASAIVENFEEVYKIILNNAK